jgi:hypothetical protein
MFFLGGADEENLAGGDLVAGLKVLHLERVSGDAFSLDNLFQGALEGVVADGAEGEGSAGVFEGVRGPVDELGKMEKEVGFDFVFAGALAAQWLRLTGKGGEEKGDGEDAQDASARTQSALAKRTALWGEGAASLEDALDNDPFLSADDN